MNHEQERDAVWHQRLQAQQASGLSVAVWCKQVGVSAWSVYHWRKRLSLPAATMTLMSVPLAGMGPGPTLEMQTPGGYVLRLSSAEQLGWLPAILAAVR